MENSPKNGSVLTEKLIFKQILGMNFFTPTNSNGSIFQHSVPIPKLIFRPFEKVLSTKWISRNFESFSGDFFPFCGIVQGTLSVGRGLESPETAELTAEMRMPRLEMENLIN